MNPTEEAKPPVVPQCEERAQLEKQLLVALDHQLRCEEATRAASTTDRLARAKQEEARARQACDVAVKALDQHQSEHGC